MFRGTQAHVTSGWQLRRTQSRISYPFLGGSQSRLLAGQTQVACPTGRALRLSLLAESRRRWFQFLNPLASFFVTPVKAKTGPESRPFAECGRDTGRLES